jgi:hypothetical protein
MIEDDACGAISELIEWQGKLMYSEKTFPSAVAVHYRFQMTSPGLEPGPPWWEAGD